MDKIINTMKTFFITNNHTGKTVFVKAESREDVVNFLQSTINLTAMPLKEEISEPKSPSPERITGRKTHRLGAPRKPRFRLIKYENINAFPKKRLNFDIK